MNHTSMPRATSRLVPAAATDAPASSPGAPPARRAAGPIRAWARALSASVLLLGAGQGRAASIDLADSPMFSTISIPGNLILALSVEWPTATTPAYPSTPSYNAKSAFLGYFDPDKCYQYKYNSTTPSSSYFKPYGAATGHACPSKTVPLWSGNYLNWSSMQTLDAFRWVLTGGYRSIDTTGTSPATVLTKTYAAKDSSKMPQKTASTANLAGATPFGTDSAWSGGLTTRLRNLGTRMWITSTNTNSNSSGSTGPGTRSSATSGAVPYIAQNSVDGSADPATTYEVFINVQVCDPGVGVETNCVLYGSTYKPEGLMQTYSSKLRYSAFGYLKEDGDGRDGGVMRARMNYIGPTKPVPGKSAETNTAAEWDGNTGIMLTDPDSSDSQATVANAAAVGRGVKISNSGAMNYLNKFGYNAQAYKSNDPVSELYYAAQRYYRKLGNVDAYSELSSSPDSATAASWLDGFPAITDWGDPILYACQKNFILGIGDVNTHRDANLPGTQLRSDPNYPGPSQVTDDKTGDKTVNVTKATNTVGQLEGLTGSTTLGNLYADTNGTSCANSGSECDTYFIAGLAYDAHTNDIRPDLDGTQTVDTYWMDVMEGQLYKHKNQYWLAAKYGGFTVPDGFTPYPTANGSGPVAPADTAWHNSTDTLSYDTTTTDPVPLAYSNDTPGTDKRPDNYFSGAQPDVMQSGLSKAFSKISSSLDTATSTAFSTVSANVTSGNASYAASYDPKTWTGDIMGSSVSFDPTGAPTYIALWDARTLLESKTADSRIIVTCCTSAGAALPFETADLAGSLSSRTDYRSFKNVTGATTQSAKNFVAYLRGDRSQEAANNGPYRTRAYLLGDIVDSKVNPVGAPSATYYDYYNGGYSTFKKTWASRKTVVYVGANDGMMHAFDGTAGKPDTCATCGTELWAYIPSFVYGNSDTAATSGLASLGNPDFTHHFLVDQTPRDFDVDFAKTSGAAAETKPDWHTVLIGGLGKGGNGYYAIDVTDPSTMTSEKAVAAKVLWEFTDPHMGYSYATPVVVKTAKYGWVAIFTSGYNNSDGIGYIFIVNVKTGALLETIATPEGSPTSPIDLATPTAFIPDYTDFTADALYVGDIQGNVWRFDLTGTSTYSSPTKIAKLADSSGNSQPVTTRPLIEIDTNSKNRYVLLGTGRLLANTDIASSAIQTFYGFVDGTSTSGGFYTKQTLPKGYSFPLTRADLIVDDDLINGIGSAPKSPMGWYIDLSASSTSHIAERVNVDPTADNGVVAFAANLPDGQVCTSSGTSRLFGVRYADGKTVLEDKNGRLTPTSQTLTSVVTDLIIQRVNGKLRLIAGDRNGTVARVSASLETSSGAQQLNWRDVTANQ